MGEQEVDEVVARPEQPSRPLIRWLQPTRGYVAAAAITAGLLATAGVVWQGWALLAVDGPRSRGGGGFSVASIVAMLLGAVVLVEIARRPQPWVRGMGDRWGRGATVLRARNRTERRVVRRAMWRGVLPAEPRLRRVAAWRVATSVSNTILLGFYLFVAAGHLGIIALGDVGPADRWASAIIGSLWGVGGAALLGLTAWLRRQARALNQAQEELGDPSGRAGRDEAGERVE